MTVPQPKIISCAKWGARPPRHPVLPVGKPDKALMHHTAGHHPELDHMPTESYNEAVAYVRAIQNLHMDAPDRRWNDTGQNFTICRNGLIFEGRHRSLELVAAGRMVDSAHCPGQNHNPGVEIEHLGNEKMTPQQYAAAVALFAWICDRSKVHSSQIFGHRDFFATACPGPLYALLPKFRQDVAAAMKGAAPKPAPKPPQPPLAQRYRDIFANWKPNLFGGK